MGDLSNLIKQNSKSDPRIALFLSKIDKYFIEWNRERQAKRPGMFHASSIISDKFCPRAAYWDLIDRKEDEPLKPSTIRIFANGVSAHEKYQEMFRKMGIARYIEQPFYSKFLDLCGTPDAIIDFFGVLCGVEIKTVNTNAFYKLSSPPKNAYAQSQVYMYLLGIPHFVIFCENKNDQNIKLFLIDFDLKEALKYVKRMRFLNKHLKLKKVPKKCFCKKKTDRKTCKYHSRCFKK